MEQQDSIAGRYRRYKMGTAKVVEWLVRTAGERCDISRIVSSFEGRGDTLRDFTAQITLEIRTSELVHLARAIASSNSAHATRVPSSITTTLRNVIDGRQNFADLYAVDSAEQDDAAYNRNRTHRYFITVLQQVQGILESIQPVSGLEIPEQDQVQPILKQAGKEKNKQTAAVASKLEEEQKGRNAFGNLSIQEPGESNIQGDSAFSSGDAVKPRLSRVTFKLQKQAEEQEFALWCHLEDLNDVRKSVMETWAQYLRGEVSFLCASIATEVAFALLRCADDAFVALQPSLDSHSKVLCALNFDVRHCIDAPQSFLHPVDSAKPRFQSNNHRDSIDLLCLVGAGILENYGAKQSSCLANMCNYKKGRPEAVDEKSYGWVSFHTFGTPLLDNVLNVAAFNECNGRFNDFMTGLTTDLTKMIPTWFVVACQIYSEIFDLLGDTGPSIGVAHLRRILQESERARDMIAAYRNDVPSARDARDEKDALLDHLRDVGGNASGALKVLDLKNEMFGRGDVFDPAWQATAKARKAFKHAYVSGLECAFPVHAGGTSFYVKATLHEQTFLVCNEDLVMHATVYLYKAARAWGLLPLEWHDLDFFIASQASTGPLVPKNIAKCKPRELLAAYEKAIGVSVAASEMLNLPVQPRLDRGTPVRPGAEFAMKVLRGIRRSEEEAVRTTSSKVVEVVLHGMATRNSQTASGHPSKDGTRTFSPVELLSTFKESFVRDEPILNFDYVGLWIDCSKLLRRIYDRIVEKTPKIKSTKIRLKDNPSQMVWVFLQEAALYQGKPEYLAGSSVATAAEAIETHIKDRGKVFLKPAQDQSSGRIPKHMWPEIPARHAGEEFKAYSTPYGVDAEVFKPVATGQYQIIHFPTLTHAALQEARKRSLTDGQNDSDATVDLADAAKEAEAPRT